MKKHITTLAIAMFLMAGLNAQTLTVADGTDTDYYPFGIVVEPSAIRGLAADFPLL